MPVHKISVIIAYEQMPPIDTTCGRSRISGKGVHMYKCGGGGGGGGGVALLIMSHFS